ncbi:MAG: hypothetical protein ACRDKW_07480 [Actinomycetota bacterium]
MTRTKATKDRPLLLRRRRDGRLYLDADGFPPRHEFSTDWLLEQTGGGVVVMDATQIRLTLANARAVYDIDRAAMATTDAHGNEQRTSTGYWGRLVSEEVG